MLVHLAGAAKIAEAAQDQTQVKTTSKEHIFLEQTRSLVPGQETKAFVPRRRLAACAEFKFDDDSSLVDGWNVLSASCEMASDFTVPTGKTLKIRKNPLVTETVVLDRQGSSSSRGRHFIVDGGTLEMEGLTLTGGYGNSASNYGGAVLVNSGSATFNICTFSGNDTAGGRGGSVYVGGGSATFNNCTFGGNNNSSTGGAVYVNAGSATFLACTFGSNKADTVEEDLLIWGNSVTIINPASAMQISGNTNLINSCASSPSVAPCDTSATSCAAAASGVTCLGGIYCGAISVTGGTCTACATTDASVCAAVTCNSGKGNADNDAANGCEVSCGTVTDGTCTACTTAAASDCTAVTCLAGKSNADNDATNGCEVIVDFLPVPDNCVINSDYHGGGEYNCNTGLKKIVNDWIAGGAAKDAVVAQYGPIETWNLAEATNLAYVFYEKFTFNADISQWIVSKVTNMEGSKYFLLLLFLFPCFIRI
jgi:hypothetical protein